MRYSTKLPLGVGLIHTLWMHQIFMHHELHMNPTPNASIKPSDVHVHVLKVQLWQSRIEIGYYPIAYFKRITEFDVL